MKMSYWRFAAMIATSTVVMFGLMYLHTYAADHVYWSETRAWMALLMGASMAIIMLAFMLAMYKNKRLNLLIFAGSATVFVLCLWLVRSQATVSGVDYMRAMIPHHSIAVLTSERAQITDPRVRKLADEIIAAQRREIAEMKYLIRNIEREGSDPLADIGPEVPPAVVPAAEAVRTAELGRVDLAEMEQAELEKAIGPGPSCRFYYSRHAGPVAAAAAPMPGSDAAPGVLKIHGKLVPVRARYPGTGKGPDPALLLVGDGLSLAVSAVGKDGDSARARGSDPIEADAVLRIGKTLEVGYAGFLQCLQEKTGRED